MKKYLIRAGYNPLVQYDIDDALFNNITGWNSGNMLYAYGVFNILFDGENGLISTYYRTDFNESEIDYINNNFDAFILPLADAFRIDWEDNLIAYTKLIRKLKIPCIVIGACLRAPYNCDLKGKFPFDNSVKEFISAVLDKSSIIGLRGFRTCEYLRNLGFSEETHFRAIGCPSLYTYGDTIKTKEVPDSIRSILFNINPNVSEKANEFFYSTLLKIPKSNIVLQEMGEFEAIYYGYRIPKWPSKKFPYSVFNDLSKTNNIKFFFDPQQWFGFASEFDISLGTRFHGTVANILSGIPHVVVPLDSRMQELIDFHHITHLDKDELEGDVTKYIDRLNFHSYQDGLQDNLNNYINFLKKNEVCSVFDKGIDISMGNSPLEKKRKAQTQEIATYKSVPLEEKLRRKKKFLSSIVNREFGKKDYFSFNNLEE